MRITNRWDYETERWGFSTLSRGGGGECGNKGMHPPSDRLCLHRAATRQTVYACIDPDLTKLTPASHLVSLKRGHPPVLAGALNPNLRSRLTHRGAPAGSLPDDRNPGSPTGGHPKLPAGEPVAWCLTEPLAPGACTCRTRQLNHSRANMDQFTELILAHTSSDPCPR